MNKVIENGKVAVLFSPGWGAGWYTWNNIEELVFDPIIVELTKVKDKHKSGTKEFNDIVDRIVNRAKEIDPEAYYGGADDLSIQWVPEGSKFVIDEYDGNESVNILENVRWLTA